MKSLLGEVITLSLCIASTLASKAPNLPSSQIFFNQTGRQKGHYILSPALVYTGNSLVIGMLVPNEKTKSALKCVGQ